jgi:uncharacterized membrane protein
MTSAQGLRFKTILLIVFMVSVAPLGDVFLGKGMKRIAPMASWAPTEVFRFFFQAFTSSTIWTGIALLLVYFVAYLMVLSWADYTYVLPASSIGCFLLAMLAHFVLHEKITPTRWAGVAFICAGVFIVGHTHPQTQATDS